MLGRHDDREPVRIDEDLSGQFRAMGVDIALQSPPTELATEQEEGFEVMPENWTSIRVFLACQTQWRSVVSLAGRDWLGLDYPGVDVVLKRLGLENADAVFADLQVMEIAALEAFGKATP